MVNLSQKLAETIQGDSYYRYMIQEGEFVYFKRKDFIKVESLEEGLAQQVIQDTIKQFDHQLQLSQNRRSKYILPYREIRISYPYACFMHEPLQDVLSNYVSKNIPFESKINLMIAIGIGLTDLHSKNIHILDLRPSTIVILKQKNKEFQIAFSGIKPFRRTDRDGCIMYQENYYTAPEIIQKKGHSELSDIYSLGLIYYQLLTGYKMSRKTPNSSRRAQPSKHEYEWMKKLLEKMIQQDPKDRYKMKDNLMILKNIKLAYITTKKY